MPLERQGQTTMRIGYMVAEGSGAPVTDLDPLPTSPLLDLMSLTGR